jgi:hypothetical protein
MNGLKKELTDNIGAPFETKNTHTHAHTHTLTKTKYYFFFITEIAF